MRPLFNLLQLGVVLSLLGLMALGAIFGQRTGLIPPWIIMVSAEPPEPPTKVIGVSMGGSSLDRYLGINGSRRDLRALSVGDQAYLERLLGEDYLRQREISLIAEQQRLLPKTPFLSEVFTIDTSTSRTSSRASSNNSITQSISAPASASPASQLGAAAIQPQSGFQTRWVMLAGLLLLAASLFHPAVRRRI